jgi:murein DD-endopeptidase MepM/ murein hydrolase activator NlpD
VEAGNVGYEVPILRFLTILVVIVLGMAINPIVMTANNYTEPEPIWPVASKNITQGFNKYHQGIDISDGTKGEVWAILPGYVESVGWDGGYGNTIVMSHNYQGKAIFSRYSHLSKFMVKQGDYLDRGVVIGKIGNTGQVRGITGLHLHFEIIDKKPIDPATFMGQ